MKSINKRLISMLTGAALILGLFAGCTAGGNSAATEGVKDKSEGGISIVTTIFPEYDWVREITKDVQGVDMTLLLDNGADLHSYQPTADDIAKISKADVFIYVGGKSDEWVNDVLKGAVNKDMTVINLLDTLGDNAEEEEVVEGMQDDEHDHDDADHDDENHDDADYADENHDDADHTDDDADHEDDEHEHEHGEAEYDEHVWLSLKNAEVIVKAIGDAIISKDSANAETYKKNVDAYLASLDELDKKYEDTVSNASVKTLLFGDRFPFRYMTDDYGLTYYAAFIGCSAETEASFETVAFLAGKVDELSLKHIMKIESSDGKIAETIKNTTKTKDQEILSMDSMQSVTLADVEAGKTYIGIMEENLNVLAKALSR